MPSVVSLDAQRDASRWPSAGSSGAIVKVAVPPASVVVRPVVGVTVMPAVSLSVLVTETSAALSPL